jgi:molybdopterin-guanine dinucleotide biosynthesis protein A
MADEKKFSGCVLAGGKSSRMGNDKAWLEINGKTFLENAVDSLRPFCSLVKIVLNKSQPHFIEKIPAECSYIFDVFENRGALGGIHAALQNCETEFAVILAVDLPFVSRKAIEKLCQAALDSKDFAAIVPHQNDGRVQPLCAVYRVKDCLPKLEELLDENDSASVRDFLKLISPKYIEANRLSANENLLFNVNHPTDFQSVSLLKNKSS